MEQYGENKTGDLTGGYFQNPRGMTLDALGNMYVADFYNHRIQQLDSAGNFITAWGSLGSGDDQFNFPLDVAIDSNGNIYVVDSGNNRIMKAAAFTSNPTALALDTAAVAENSPVGTIVGTFGSEPAGSYTYTLVSGAGSADNASFTIAGDKLKLAAVPDFETKNTYQIRVRTTPAVPEPPLPPPFFEQTFTITVTDANDTPGGISLSKDYVADNAAAGTTVGTLTTTDQDAGDTFTYSLAAGAGDTDNASFAIDGDQLKLAVIPHYAAKNSYSVRIRSTDAGGAFVERAFTIRVAERNDSNRLVSLTVGTGSLDPAFDPDISSYVVNGAGNINSIDVTATAADPGATITIAGSAAVSGVASSVYLDQGANLIPIVVTAADGQTQKAYVLSVNGTVSDADLSSLSVSTGAIAFDPATLDYTQTVASGTYSLNLTAAQSDPKALMFVNGSPLDSGVPKAVNLDYGSNVIEVMVVAQDATTKTYTITVTREYPAIAWNAGSLTASAITAHGMTLTWPGAVSAAGISGYRVYKDGVLLSTLAGSETSYNAAGLNPNTSYTFTVKAVDSGGNISPELTLTVSTSDGSSPAINTAALAGATVGAAYNAQLTASGGSGPLSIDAATGVISGTPAAAGTSVVNITLTDSLGAVTARGYTLTVFYPAVTGRYIVTPAADAAVYTVRATPEGIATMTVKNGVSGFKYFTVDISLTESHAGDETAVFVLMRGGVQIAINATTADFDTVSRAKAAFNVQAGDVIKVYLVDDLNNTDGFNPTLLQ
ncbi:MAG: cadherin-like beta sandwich domain-containing protein [Bacillota bacterium]